MFSSPGLAASRKRADSREVWSHWCVGEGVALLRDLKEIGAKKSQPKGGTESSLNEIQMTPRENKRSSPPSSTLGWPQVPGLDWRALEIGRP